MTNTKQVLLTGKIQKRDGKIVAQSIKADWLVSVSFPRIKG